MESKKLLVIGLTWPEPTATAAGVRMMQLLQVFSSRDLEITFVSASKRTGGSEDLQALGITTEEIELNNASFDEFLKILKPEIVLFDRFLTEEQYGWRVAEVCPKALRILDSEDLHSLRYVRETCFKKNIPFTVARWLADGKTKRELASILRCDLTLVISSFEMELLEKIVKFDASLLLHLPFMHNEIFQQNDWPEFNDRRDFLFIGGGLHSPNVDAIKYLEQEIWPKIHSQISDVQCHIYGAYLPNTVIKLHNPKKGFYIKGKTNSVSEVMKMSRVCLAPLRFGAGIKGKLVDAMLNGTPSVTTGIGAEGMHANMDWNGFVSESQEDFVQKSIELYTDKTVWEEAQGNGIKIINTLYSKSSLEKRLMNRITEKVDNLEHHRLKNIMGGILAHHTLQSTKYMAKWIEEKNKGN
ncbi:glycosyltransferase family 4 protein [Maribacter litopenaei]|uniref:Glycosyltransferase family 4 protein n=1 Tax=Maribacter litopenaei TaxID=2976127 RepID=A0ABY5YCU9_9FLAO|nr:glycosyltransferase family 4 protein [Maribacter litopenaei]UWX56544.1 glycosyltransferase family 4 protein [Maribacter litopenaei]